MNKYLAALFLLFIPKVYAITPVQANIVASTPKNTAQVDIWAGYGLLKHIASCESWGDPDKEPRQFRNGKVLLGDVNPDDIGAAQINLPTWGKKAKELGYDIYTYQGNISMAKWIFNHYGSTPWNWSIGCWGKYKK